MIYLSNADHPAPSIRGGSFSRLRDLSYVKKR